MATLVKLGRDGKLFPAHWRTADELARLRDLEHDLRCRQLLTVREVQAALAKQGIRRSIGSVHRDVTDFQCPRCAPKPPPPPPPRPRVRAEIFEWR